MQRKLILTASVLLTMPAAALAQGDQQNFAFEEIVRQCVTETQAGGYGGSKDPMADCLKAKDILAHEEQPPEVYEMGIERRGLQPPAILDAYRPQQAQEETPADSFAGGVAGDGAPAAQAPAAKAQPQTPSAQKKTYIQSGKSGSGAKPVFLNR